MARISSDTLVQALSATGFAVYRRTEETTILERGVRAVVVPAGPDLGAEVIMDVRRMAGLSWKELDAALEVVTSSAAALPP